MLSQSVHGQQVHYQLASWLFRLVPLPIELARARTKASRMSTISLVLKSKPESSVCCMMRWRQQVFDQQDRASHGRHDSFVWAWSEVGGHSLMDLSVMLAFSLEMECFDQQVSHQQVVFAWVFVLRTLSAGSIPAGIVLVTFRIPYSDKCPAYLCLLQNALPTLSVACSMAGHMLVRVTQGLHGSRSCQSMYSAETLHA